MPSDAGVKVTNLREINKALAAIGVPKEAVKDAGKESGELVANEARSLVPVRTGKLRDSIRVGATARGKITLMAGNNRTSKSAVPYANPIHWGWYKRHIAPQPFFANALGYTRAEIYDTYFEQLEKLITEQYQKTGKV
jgi:HK97 gp10 family phage protein